MTISAKIIADSISPAEVRITTFELEFPRIILAELNTHRVFSRNAASTRAIPIKQQLQFVANRMFKPSPFTRAQKGMASNDPAEDQETASALWCRAFDAVSDAASRLADIGVHKQHAGRLLEPFTYIKVVLTATEFENFWWLRDHPDAQPEIAELARVMRKEYAKSEPIKLEPGEWHVPYYGEGHWPHGGISEDHTNVDAAGYTLEQAIAISASCCAQVSYRKLDDSLEKAEDIYRRLVGSLPPHFSPMEHQATPMLVPEWIPGTTPFDLEGLDRDAVTHLDSRGKYWSGNLQGWCQSRQLIAKGLGLEPMTSVPYDRSK